MPGLGGARVRGMVRLRGHHLVCLRFYQGEGFPNGYGENLRSVVMAAREGGVTVVLGADQVCEFCPSMKDGLCLHAPGWEEEIRAMDEAAMALLGVRPKDRISWEEVGARLRVCFAEWHRRFCLGCPWQGACRGNESYRKKELALSSGTD